jgi:nucleotide-binding universal stress UspA family protein
MKNILVAVEMTNDEFSDQFNIDDNKVLEKALELAKAFDSKLWLLHIAAPDPEFVGYDVGPQYIRDFRAKDLRNEHKQLQAYADNFIKQGIDAEGLLIQGMTIEMIIEESKKLNIDLIITGHHDHNFLYKAIVGSVSSAIIKQSKIPVLIVPV